MASHFYTSDRTLLFWRFVSDARVKVGQDFVVEVDPTLNQSEISRLLSFYFDPRVGSLKRHVRLLEKDDYALLDRVETYTDFELSELSSGASYPYFANLRSAVDQVERRLSVYREHFLESKEIDEQILNSVTWDGNRHKYYYFLSLMQVPSFVTPAFFGSGSLKARQNLLRSLENCDRVGEAAVRWIYDFLLVTPDLDLRHYPHNETLGSLADAIGYSATEDLKHLPVAKLVLRTLPVQISLYGALAMLNYARLTSPEQMESKFIEIVELDSYFFEEQFVDLLRLSWCHPDTPIELLVELCEGR